MHQSPSTHNEEFLFASPKLLSTPPSFNKKKFLKLSSSFLSTPLFPSSPPSGTATISSDPLPQQCPPGPISSPFPLRYRSLPPSQHRPLPSVSSPFPNILPPLFGTSSLPAPLRLSGIGPLRPQRSLPFGIICPNRTKRRAYVRFCLAERCRKEGGARGRRGLVPESQEGASEESRCQGVEEWCRKEGALGVGEGWCRKAREEHRERADAGEWREGSGEGEGDKRERGGTGEEEGGGTRDEI